jgi:hypothetical protein
MANKIDISGRLLARASVQAVASASVLGTIATAVVYSLSLTVVFEIVPTSMLAAAAGGPGRRRQ